jgi:hypothetical protein
MEQEQNTGVIDFIRSKIKKLQAWMQPDPSDKLLLQIVKFALKCVVLLVLIALSPALLVVLLFVFLVTI